MGIAPGFAAVPFDKTDAVPSFQSGKQRPSVYTRQPDDCPASFHGRKLCALQTVCAQRIPIDLSMLTFNLNTRCMRDLLALTRPLKTSHPPAHYNPLRGSRACSGINLISFQALKKGCARTADSA